MIITGVRLIGIRGRSPVDNRGDHCRTDRSAGVIIGCIGIHSGSVSTVPVCLNIVQIGGILRSLRGIQQLVLGMVARITGCLPKHVGKVGGRNHAFHHTQSRVQVG